MANTTLNSTSEDSRPVTSNLPDPPTKSAKPHSQPCASSSAVTRRNPPHSQCGSAAMSSVSESCSGTPATTSMETHPCCKTALATKSLLEQVQLHMGDDSEETSNSITEIEADEDEVEDNEDNALSNDQLANSDVEIAHKLVVAPCNKTSNAAPTSRASGKAQQA